MKSYTLYITAFLAVVATQGCTDQRDLYVSSQLQLAVTGDWQPSLGKTDMTMNATAMAFDHNGDVIKEYFYNPSSVDIPVTGGTYDVMLFNGLMYSPTDTHLDDVYFRGTDALDTFEAVASRGSAIGRIGTRAEDEYIASNYMEIVTSGVQQVDVEASKSYFLKYKNGQNGYDIPTDDIYVDLNIVPVALSYATQVVMTIENISSAAGASAALYGFVGSAYMASREPSHFYVTHHFNLNSRRMLDRTGDVGTIESPVFVTFGPPLDALDSRFEVYVKMVLVNGSEMTRSFDVTDQMKPIIEEIKENLGSRVDINYELEIPIDVEVELPIVEPVGGSIGIEGWDDEELIHVPINVNTKK
jgi:hypothetical protein